MLLFYLLFSVVSWALINSYCFIRVYNEIFPENTECSIRKCRAYYIIIIFENI